MKKTDSKKAIVIIGNGIAGDEAALAARKIDAQARVMIISEDTTPLYSACVLADYIGGEIPRERVILRSSQDYQQQDIQLLLSKRVCKIDVEKHLLSVQEGEDINYQKLILATGSRPTLPPVPGSSLPGVFSLKTLNDADQIIKFLDRTTLSTKKSAAGKRAIVVGSGPIGIEAAIALKHRGVEVVIVEILDRLLPRLFDPVIANQVKNILEREGIRVLTSEKLVEIQGSTTVTGVKTDQRTLKTDLVLMVTGMRPEVELAQKAGIKLGPMGGIEVNEHLETSAQDVWACGDCLETVDRVTKKPGLYMLWNNARSQGQIAGANAAGAKRKYSGSLNVTSLCLYESTVASVGAISADLTNGKYRLLYDAHKGLKSQFCLILDNNRVAGAQALGCVQRVGGMLGLVLSGDDLPEIIARSKIGKNKSSVWALRGFEKSLDGELLNSAPDGEING